MMDRNLWARVVQAASGGAENGPAVWQSPRWGAHVVRCAFIDAHALNTAWVVGGLYR